MLKDVAFILRSKKRVELLTLLEKPRTPTQLAKHMKSSLSNVSLKLGELAKAGYVVCINPEDGKGRIYEMTEKGRKTLDKIREMD